eukprot:2063394-Prymnesium_polylepis.1
MGLAKTRGMGGSAPLAAGRTPPSCVGRTAPCPPKRGGTQSGTSSSASSKPAPSQRQTWCAAARCSPDTGRLVAQRRELGLPDRASSSRKQRPCRLVCTAIARPEARAAPALAATAAR